MKISLLNSISWGCNNGNDGDGIFQSIIISLFMYWIKKVFVVVVVSLSIDPIQKKPFFVDIEATFFIFFGKAFFKIFHEFFKSE